MRKMALFVLLISLALFSSCEKKLIEFTIDLNRTSVFTLDETSGAFDESETITASDIRGALDIPDDAEITDVDIEALSVSVVVREENEATSLRVNGSYVDQLGQGRMYENYLIPLEGTVGVNTPFIGINNLLSEGISRLRGKIEAFIQNLDNQSFQIRVWGNSEPPGVRVSLDLHLRVKMTIKYKECVEVFKGLMDEGEDCD
jgi:hypothetical protein